MEKELKDILNLTAEISKDTNTKAFWSYDRKITIMTFVSCVSVLSLLNFVPGILAWPVFLSFFWISFMFSRLNQISVLEIPNENAEENKEESKKPNYIILNSQGEDITKNAERTLIFFPILLVLSIFVPIVGFDFFISYIEYYVPQSLYPLFFIIPGYVTFFSYFFITGIPFSVIFKVLSHLYLGVENYRRIGYYL